MTRSAATIAAMYSSALCVRLRPSNRSAKATASNRLWRPMSGRRDRRSAPWGRERGVNVRVWRDASMASGVGDLDVEGQLGGVASGVELRSSRPSGELMHLKGYCNRLLRTGSANFNCSGETARTMTSWR
jgi:hypothetical protein